MLHDINVVELGRWITGVSDCSMSMNASGVPLEFCLGYKNGAIAVPLMCSPPVEVLPIRGTYRCCVDEDEVHLSCLIGLIGEMVECWIYNIPNIKFLRFDAPLGSMKWSTFKRTEMETDNNHGATGNYCAYEAKSNRVDAAEKIACLPNQNNRNLRAISRFPLFTRASLYRRLSDTQDPSFAQVFKYYYSSRSVRFVRRLSKMPSWRLAKRPDLFETISSLAYANGFYADIFKASLINEPQRIFHNCEGAREAPVVPS